MEESPGFINNNVACTHGVGSSSVFIIRWALTYDSPLLHVRTKLPIKYTVQYPTQPRCNHFSHKIIIGGPGPVLTNATLPLHKLNFNTSTSHSVFPHIEAA